MTLEEAIKHAEATAIENEKEAKRKREHGGWYYDSEARALAICAEENRQLAKWLRELQRARVLLKATHDILEAADDSPYVEDVLAILVHYDDADCDGSCLMDDIEYYFDEFDVDVERRIDGKDKV